METPGTSMITNVGQNALVMMTIQQTMERLSLTEEVRNYIMDRRDLWVNFGKMNSHIYRAMLMKRMADAGLNGEAKLMVFFLFSVIKNQGRVLRAMDAMADVDKQAAWFTPVRNFINVHVTQYVSESLRSRKFPAVNIPNCNPGFDMLAYCMMTHPNERTINDLFMRPTAVQLALDSICQELARQGYAHYWDVVVQGSRNPDAKGPASELEPPKYREAYYQTAAGDTYKLIKLNLQEVNPSNPDLGYTLKDVYEYLLSVDPRNEYNPTTAKLEDDYRMLTT